MKMMNEELENKIERMDFQYDKGYWKAMLDLKNCLSNLDLYHLKSKRQTLLFFTSLCDYLLRDSLAMDLFRMYGGDVAVVVSNNKVDKGKVLEIKER